MPGGGWVTTHEDITERRLAEDQVREQRLQLDTALNNMTQGLLMFDSQARLVICNWRYLQMYDLSASVVKPGLPLARAASSCARRKARSRATQTNTSASCKPSSPKARRSTLVAKLGDGRIITVSNIPMPDGRWVSTHEDVTERRRAEERLHEQKLQLDTALNNMSQGLNMFDADGRLVVCNDRYLDMYRVPHEIARPGCTVRDLVQARIASGTFFSVDPDKYADELVDAMRERQPTNTTMVLPDNREIAVHSQPTPDGGGWVVTHEDITERRKAERERDRSQVFASTVIESVPTAIIVKDAHDLRYLLINRACRGVSRHSTRAHHRQAGSGRVRPGGRRPHRPTRQGDAAAQSDPILRRSSSDDARRAIRASSATSRLPIRDASGEAAISADASSRTARIAGAPKRRSRIWRTTIC